ncbi:MAG: NAD(P)H-hydrate dehydratase, partial [Planctomycetota bacterium]
PGLGRSAAIDQITADLYTGTQRPLVVDADGLNALAGADDVLTAPGGPRILTPHPGEFARLLGKRLPTREEQVRAAEDLARRWGCVLVLKGHGTAVTDGSRTYVNRTGNPGMAVGGSGDVLSGCIAALGAAGLPPFDAACLGVYLHGAAGDLAAEQLGEDGMTAVDLSRNLPAAIKRYRENDAAVDARDGR